MRRAGWALTAGLVVAWSFSAAVRAQAPMDAAAAAFRDDVHAAAGLTCVACHTGAGGTSGYAAPERTTIAPLCASCHGDAAYMRRFDPQVRVDQMLQYQTSTHGRQMTAGETRVATCSDCHGAHGVRRVTDPRSPVAPLNVTATCRTCHGDAALMTAFGRDSAPPEDWTASVHASALLQRGDTSAPTCVGCHGSHGATPPGVASIANTCAQCHLREAELFRSSPKRDIFEAIGQAECLTCHGNHRIESPTDAWVGVDEGRVCALCHEPSSDSSNRIREMRTELDRLSAALGDADALLIRAERAGMPVDDERLALQEARGHQVEARALVHAFSTAPLADVAAAGLGAAGRAHQGGQRAMQELATRRRGLAGATLLVLAFLATLWFKIRRLPPLQS